jgi:hypothetical protein
VGTALRGRRASIADGSTVTLISKLGGMSGSGVLRLLPEAARLRSAFPTPALGPKRLRSHRRGAWGSYRSVTTRLTRDEARCAAQMDRLKAHCRAARAGVNWHGLMGLIRDTVNTDDERKAATKAQAVLSWLVPSTERTDETIFALRHAAQIAATAIQPNFSSQMALTNARHEAATALTSVCGALSFPIKKRGSVDRPSALTQAMIDRAKSAVEAWLNGLDTALRLVE